MCYQIVFSLTLLLLVFPRAMTTTTLLVSHKICPSCFLSLIFLALGWLLMSLDLILSTDAEEEEEEEVPQAVPATGM